MHSDNIAIAVNLVFGFARRPAKIQSAAAVPSNEILLALAHIAARPNECNDSITMSAPSPE